MTDKTKGILMGLGTAAMTAALVAVPLSCGHDKAPEIHTVPAISQKALQPYFPNSSKSEVKDIERRIITTKENKAPTHTYITYTQQAADAQAQRYAKQDKADKVIKQTSEKDVIDEKGKPTGDKIIQNDYYAINMNRKHDIKVGVAVVDDKKYATLSYRNRDIEYGVMHNPDTKKTGVSVAVTVAKW